MKSQLEIGDKIKRFEVRLTREVDHIYVIDNVTKTLAKSGKTTFKRELDYEINYPVKSNNKIIARVINKKKQTWTSPDFFLIENY